MSTQRIVLKDMNMTYTIIDLEKYNRKSHFDYFRSLCNPFAGVTVDVDVTKLVTFCKENSYSFYIVFTHAVCLAANKIPEFRRRIKDDKIIEYDTCNTSHIESLDDGTYCYCTLVHDMPFEQYIYYSALQREKAKSGASINEDECVDSLYFISTLPWFKYSSLIQPFGSTEESNPRISWGKYELDYNNRLLMPVSVLVNHALVDGIHIAGFYEKLKEEIDIIAEA